MNMKRILGAAGIAAILATASPARADKAQELAAQALYDKALELMKAGKPASACPLLSESQRLDPAAGTQYRLAECFEKTGRPAEAWKLYTEVAEASKRAGRKDREEQASERADIVRKLLPRLTITIPPELAKADGLAVTRDGKSVPREEWNREIPVEPGEHTVEAQATGKKAWRGTMTARAGATAEVRVPLLDAVAVVAGPVAPKSDGALLVEPAVVEAPRSGPNKMVVIAGAAAGIVALGMGVGFTAAATGKANNFAEATASGCTDGMHGGQYWGCSADVLALDSSRVTFTNLAGSTFIAAGLLGAGTLTYVLLSSSSRSKSPPAAALVVLPGVAFGTATFPW
jgi:hypothetical protein